MDFVLVHGAWHGAWVWRKLLPGLWRSGHRAFAVTLAGSGDRARERSPSIRVETHVGDVAALIEIEELEHVVLVGHSYSGLVITGVADRLAQRLSQLVYIDAVVPKSGESWSSGHPAPVRDERRAAIARLGVIEAPDPTRAFGLHGDDAVWVTRHQTPHPGSVYDDPLFFDERRVAGIARMFIDCTSPALPTIALMRERVRREPGWNVVELATGHAPMVSEPAAVLALLLGLADEGCGAPGAQPG